MKSKRYQIICADPPWQFADRLKMLDGVKRGAASNYKTLRLPDIMALPIENVAAPDAILALWVPSSMLADGLAVMLAWGFKQKQVFTWIKTKKYDPDGLAFGMGWHFRGCSEHALIGTRGSPKPRDHAQRNVDLSPGLPHSSKPEALQERLERMYGGNKLELFARRSRQGWDCVGLESPQTPGVDLRDWLAGHKARGNSRPK